MGDLEQVPAPSVARDGLEDVLVVVVFEVPSEQGPLPPHAHSQYDGRAVDGATVGEDAVGHGVAWRPQDLHARVTQWQ
jgi:hypothetical protein